MEHRRRRQLRHPARPRRQPAHVQHRQGHAGRRLVGGHVRGRLAVRRQVTAYDSPIFIADAAVYLMATQPDLGITDPYALDQTQFDAAIALLEQQKAIVGEYWSDYTKPIEAFKSGTTAVGTTWQVIANLAQAEGAQVEAIKPEEGATGWSDTWMVAKDTRTSTAPTCGSTGSPRPRRTPRWPSGSVRPRPTRRPASSPRTRTTATTFHADDDDYWEDVYYWNTPTEPVPGRSHRRQVRAVRGVDRRPGALCAPELGRSWGRVVTRTAPSTRQRRHPRRAR